MSLEKGIRELLECTICKEGFETKQGNHYPKLLLCGHTACFQCLSKMFNNGAICCPCCRFSTNISHPNQLSANFALIEVLDGLSKSNHDNQFCAECKVESKDTPATVFCTVCEPFHPYCDSCFTKLHSIFKLFQLHKKAQLSERLLYNKMCTEHDEKLKLFCLKDQVPVCIICKEKGENHENHETVPIQKAYEQVKNEISQTLNEVERIRSQLDTHSKTTFNQISSIEQGYTEISQRINEEYNKIINALNARKKHLLEEALKEKTIRIPVLEHRLNTIAKAQSEVCVLIAECTTAIQKNDNMMIQSKRSIDQHLKLMKQSTKEFEDSSFVQEVSEIPFSFDSKSVIGSIQQFGSIGAPEAPTVIECKVSFSSITVSWNTPPHHHTIKQYAVEIAPVENKQHKDDSSTLAFVEVYRGSETKCNINDLKKQSEYAVRSRCYDERVWGKWSSYKIVKTLNFTFRCRFTTLGSSGPTGPTQLDGYQNQPHHSQVRLQDGIQLWTIPCTGMYRIEACGASGGANMQSTNSKGGRGAKIVGTFELKQGQQLKILIGQKGGNCDISNGGGGGGGGGTFVTDMSNVPLLIAAGGNGGNWPSWNTNGPDGQVSNSGDVAGKSGRGGGGGSLTRDGVDGGDAKGGKSFISEGVGGQPDSSYGSVGGFGGGGGSCHEGGGGGGYSGGSVVPENQYNTSYPTYGAGSYNTGTNEEKVGGYNEGDGLLNVELL